VPIKKVEDVLAIHRDFAAEALKRVFEGDGAPGLPDSELAGALARAEARLARVKEAREDALRRYDDEIARCSARVEQVRQAAAESMQRAAAAASEDAAPRKGKRRS
jgi:hypothetical protein